MSEVEQEVEKKFEQVQPSIQDPNTQAAFNNINAVCAKALLNVTDNDNMKSSLNHIYKVCVNHDLILVENKNLKAKIIEQACEVEKLGSELNAAGCAECKKD